MSTSFKAPRVKIGALFTRQKKKKIKRIKTALYKMSFNQDDIQR